MRKKIKICYFASWAQTYWLLAISFVLPLQGETTSNAYISKIELSTVDGQRFTEEQGTTLQVMT